MSDIRNDVELRPEINVQVTLPSLRKKQAFVKTSYTRSSPLPSLDQVGRHIDSSFESISTDPLLQTPNPLSR